MARNLRSWWYSWLNRRTAALRPQSHPRHQRPFLEVLEDRYLLSGVYTVSSTADDGSANTLRAAINAVNAGTDNEIDFAIGAAGSAQTITLQSALPAITASNVFINGTTQEGGGTTPEITLNGTNAGNNSDGLLLNGANCTVSGLIVENFGLNGIELAGSHNVVGGTAAGAGNVLSGNGVIPQNNGSGVFLDGSATGSLVQGNKLGTNVAGTAALGNFFYGVDDNGSDSTIGGSVAGARNIISGNRISGVYEAGSGAVVAGNFIGTNVFGTAALGSYYYDGVDVLGSNDTIGGSVAGSRNIISGNKGQGVYVDNTGVVVAGNFIGTDVSGNNAVANSGSGIYLDNPANDNTIGGTVSAARNVISGNSSHGVYIRSTGNQVQGNFIGTNLSSNGALANAQDGVSVIGNDNTIGGTVVGARNVISGNAEYGIDVGGASSVAVMGNYVGINNAGTAAVGNKLDGVAYLYGGVSAGIIGGTSFAARNVISGNGGGGLDITGSGYLVQGNFIGTNAAGTSALGNSGIGIDVQGPDNTLGGTAAGARNVVSGNGGNGIELYGGPTTGNLVQGNFVGTDYTGTKAIGNLGSYGVEDVNGADNTFGGTTATARNVISGNAGVGLDIQSVSGDVVQGDYIGTDVTGSKAIGNGNGISIYQNNFTLGGTTVGARNLISGNTGYGVYLDPEGPVVVEGNFIGTNASGTAALGNSIGVDDGAANTTIAGTIGGTTSAARNLISGNTGYGILIVDTYATLVEGDYIGTDVSGTKSVGNGTGIATSTDNGTTIGGTTSAATNIISGNVGDGIYLGTYGGGTQDTVVGNRIGIDNNGNALGNGGNGIENAAGENTIGGTVASARNFISNNGKNGILLDNGATLVEGNYVGLNLNGQAAMGNSGNGIEIDFNSNTIGGTVAGARNLISGNVGHGIDIAGGDNLVEGNFIGTDSTGKLAVGNGVNGVEDTGSSNTIGGTVTGARNIVSGNTGDGISQDAGGQDTIEGNYVGTDVTGSVGLANGSQGVYLAGSNNTIGGSVLGARNVLSGNTTGDGILFNSTSGGNVVEGNFIGTNASGTGALANTIGIANAGNNNTFGGTTAATRNVISGNTTYGILLFGNGNTVEGNYVGTDATGNKVLANNLGIHVQGNGNAIGGTVAGAGNLVSGNSADGIRFDGPASGNTVQGNFVGTNVNGTAALANGLYGVEFQDKGNDTLGGTMTGARNLISGNHVVGVYIGNTVSGIVVQGNFIGTDLTGGHALANGGNGIEDSGQDNTIGGTASAARNVISGNGKDGVKYDSSVSGGQVLGNFIGVDSSGTHALGNGANGVEDGGTDNTIGGEVAGSRNVISANAADGVLYDNSASGGHVQENYLGLDVTSTKALGNGANGVEIAGINNTVGGTLVQDVNLIGGNGGSGVYIDSGATGNAVYRNYLGTNTTGSTNLANGAYGVDIFSSNNTVGGTSSSYANAILFNIQGGVNVGGGSGNSVRENTLYYNGPTQTGPGITEAAGTNNGIASPILTGASQVGTALTVTGTYSAPVANVTYVLEFYANFTGDPEGQVFLGRLTLKPTQAGGSIPFTFQTNTNRTTGAPLITATMTDSLGDTSVFSAGKSL